MQRSYASSRGAEGQLLGGGSTYGHPKGFIYCLGHTLLEKIATRTGKMTDDKGVNGLSPSAYLALCSSEVASTIRHEARGSFRPGEMRAAAVARVTISSRQNEGGMMCPLVRAHAT